MGYWPRKGAQQPRTVEAVEGQHAAIGQGWLAAVELVLMNLLNKFWSSIAVVIFGAVILILIGIVMRMRSKKRAGEAEKLRNERGERGLFFELSSFGGMATKYDVVVVGSGYGAGCAALRFSAARKRGGGSDRVAVLERGREMLPGSFPESTLAAMEHVHVTMHNKNGPPKEVGSKLGLYDLRVFNDLMVVQGCGLGGTSLMNANVVIEADRRIYTHPRWPAALRGDFEPDADGSCRMDLYFGRARDQIGASTYPDNWPQLTKLEALRYATERVTGSLGEQVAGAAGAHAFGPGHLHQLEWEKTPIAVSFEERHHNRSGFVQPACNLCGNCCSGCNTGAKNTVNTNYIADAWAHGAKVFTGLTVTRVEKVKVKTDEYVWAVYYKPTDEQEIPERWRSGERFVLADRVVLGAGSLGSTEILLRSKKGGLVLSDQLGRHYSGNGDSLGFATGISRKVASFGNQSSTNEAQDYNFAIGPCITSVTKVTEIEDLGGPVDTSRSKDFVVQDCAIPGVLRPLGNTAVTVNSFDLWLNQVFGAHHAQRRPSSLAGIARRLSLRPSVRRGPSDHIEPFLVMSHDDENLLAGTMLLGEDDRLNISWEGAAQVPSYAHADRILQQLGDALQQDAFIDNPGIRYMHRATSVHPLGGACMGDDRKSGVVNHCGQVFDGAHQLLNGVHKGLYVMDGAIVPVSLGINPLLTITALAERCMEHAINENGLNVPQEGQVLIQPPLRKVVDTRLTEPRTMLTFTERMEGSVTGTDGVGHALSFVLMVTFKSLEKLSTDPGTLGTLSGVVQWGQERLSVCSGDIRLFAVDENVVAGRRMVYRFDMIMPTGTLFRFDGYKMVERRRYSAFLPLDIWQGTTTLHCTITREDTNEQWTGILRIHCRDLIAQMATLRAWRVGALVRMSTWMELGRFLLIFATQVCRVYLQLSGGSLGKASAAPPRMVGQESLSYSSREEGQPMNRGLFQPMTYYPSTAADFKPNPIILLHGMAVSSSIFSTVTINTNLVEHLTARGFDVYVPELRMSIAVPEVVISGRYDLDTIALRDIPGVIADVCADFAQRRGVPLDGVRVSVLGHCAGGSALAISLLHDQCPATRGRLHKVAFSQVSIFSEAAFGNSIKAHLHLSEILTFAPLATALTVGGAGAFLCRLAWLHWESWTPQSAITFMALGVALLWWGVHRLCWRLTGIDPGSYHCPLFECLICVWAWCLNGCSRESCSQGCCHWITFLYGLLYQHENLNHDTHAAFPSLFGLGSMRLFNQLAASCRRGCVVQLPADAIDRFVATGTPVRIVHGSRNRCWARSGAVRTINELHAAVGRTGGDVNMYTLSEVADYGHLDCIFGKDAATDVYPHFSEFFA